MPAAQAAAPKPHGIHPAAVDLVRRFEGLRLDAYRCPAGVATIGYGHTAGVQMGQTITAADAEILLANDLLQAARIVDRAVAVPLTDRQRGVLASFVFNVGPGAKGVKDGFVTLKNGKPSTMLRKLNAGDYAGAGAEFAKWTKGGGRVLPGLVARRAAEAALFMADVESDEPMAQAVEAQPAVRPAAQSRIVKTAVTGSIVGTIATAVSEAAPVLDQMEGIGVRVGSLAKLLPAGSLPWVLLGIAVLAIFAMVWFRVDMARQQEGA